MDWVGNNWLVALIFSVFIIILYVPKVFDLLKRRKYDRLLLNSGIRDIDKMTGYEFERYLESLFRALGYKSSTTSKSGDYGADLLLKGENSIVLQAKRYGYKNNVSLNAVREVYGAKAYYQTDEAWVITNSFYTKQAKELAKACKVRLLDRYDLQKFIVQVEKKKYVSWMQKINK